jgi:hypothetical protein
MVVMGEITAGEVGESSVLKSNDDVAMDDGEFWVESALKRKGYI